MEQQPRLPLWFLVVNWALIAVAFGLGFVLGGRRLADIPEPQRTALDLVHRTILESHVDPQRAGDLIDRAIAGMVESLDPYSRYVPPSQVTQYEEANYGHYEGIGAEFRITGDAVVVWFPLPGSPAEAAGLRPGDELIAVDGVPIGSASERNDTTKLVRGQAGTDVRLTLRREGATLELTVRRGDVQKNCVKWSRFVDAEAGLGYLHLTDFHPRANQLVRDAIAELQQARPLRGLIVDLRFDGGGNLDECIALARTFLPSGVIVTQRRRGSEEIERHEANAADCLHPTLPLVLLVNEHSASASEVLAGALQDHGRAAIVGVRTHGKAFVNTVYTWKDLDFRLKLTTGRYLTPNGHDIERNHGKGAAAKDTGGIAPDFEVVVDAAQKARIRDALRDSEVPAPWRAAVATLATRTGLVLPTGPQPALDAQLARAIDALRTRVAAAPPEPR